MNLQEAIQLLEEMMKAGWKLGWAGGNLNSFSLSYTTTAYWVDSYVDGSTIQEMMEKVDADWRDRMRLINYGRS